MTKHHPILIPASGKPKRESCCREKDTIAWKNGHASFSVSLLTLPTCVTPQTVPPPVASGQTTPIVYTVTGAAPGSYDYTYEFGAKRSKHPFAPQAGTIDVS